MGSPGDNTTAVDYVSMSTGETSETNVRVEGPLSVTSYTIIGIYMIVICGFAFVGNVILGLIMLHSGAWKKPIINLYIFTIIVATLIESLAGFPLVITSSLNGRWLFGEAGCAYYAFVTYTCVLVVMTCYMFVSLHRYRVIVQLVPADNPDTRRWVICSVVGSWTYGLCWSVCPFLGWGHFAPEPFATSCSLDWTSTELSAKIYNVMVFIFLLFLPVGVMVCTSALVMKKLNTQVGHSAVTATITVSTTDGHINVNNGRANHSANLHSRSLKIIVVTLVLFVLAWFPYGIMSMMANFGVPINPEASVLPTIMAKTHCAVNPIVYFIFFRKYRQSARELFGLCDGQE